MSAMMHRCIISKGNNHKSEKKLEVCKSYNIVKLYGNDNRNAEQWTIEENYEKQNNIRESILKEFEKALKELKHNKATRIDNIIGELLSAMERQGIKHCLK